MIPDDLRYSRMRWNAPLSESHARLLLERFEIEPGSLVLDLGCGWGELLIEAVRSGSHTGRPVTGVGVDPDASALARGRASAAERNLEAQVTFVEAPAEAWPGSADRVVSIGASHAWGGTQKALTALGSAVETGGRLLFGDGCWENTPSDAAMAIFGNDVLPLPEVIGHARTAGWRVLHLSTADQREWDDFESTWRAGREVWLALNSDDEQAPAVRSAMDARLTEYLEGYRGVLGFCYLVLAR